METPCSGEGIMIMIIILAIPSLLQVVLLGCVTIMPVVSPIGTFLLYSL